jgi:proton glutamate symport protein
MSLTQRVLAALAAGLAAGVAVSVSESTLLHRAVDVVSPVGTLWVNAIRMTVVPLIVSLLITGIASGTARDAGSVGGRSLLLFSALIAVTLPVTMVVAPPLLSMLNLDLSSTATLGAGSGATELPPFSDFLLGLIPTNPIRAAADGEMLPLIIFSTLFGLAITRLDAPNRAHLVGFFTAITKAMYVIVEWVLAAAPIGVFALIMRLAADNGVALVGTLGGFLLIVCGLLLVSLLLLYPITAFFSGIPLTVFARAIAPVQAVGFSTRSSLATLPAMVTAAEKTLGLSKSITSISLPVAASVFKYASPTARLTGTLFVAQLYGIDLAFPQFVGIAAAIGVLSFYSPGIPSGGLFVMTPVYLAFGLPI